MIFTYFDDYIILYEYEYIANVFVIVFANNYLNILN